MSQLMMMRSHLLLNAVKKQRFVFIFSTMILFWAIFDGIMTYSVPIVITSQGYSDTVMGLIYASSSVVGAIFDFVISKFFKNTNYRRMFILMFAFSLIYPLLLWEAKALYMFFIAMAVWGMYWDFHGFGVFDFISRYTKKSENTQDFGILNIFHSIGSIIAPLLAGVLIIEEAVSWEIFSVAWVFLIIAMLFFISLLVSLKKVKPYVKEVDRVSSITLLKETRIWEKIGKKLWPVLILTFFLFFVEAFFWTLAPIIAEEELIGHLGAFLLASYTIPTLLIGWFVGSIVKKFGKLRSAICSILIGSAILSLFGLMTNLSLLIPITFFGALFMSVALPSVNGTFADYISNDSKEEEEIQGLQDMSFNVAYVAGPICAGLFSDLFGITNAFSVLGLIGIGIALILLFATPKRLMRAA